MILFSVEICGFNNLGEGSCPEIERIHLDLATSYKNIDVATDALRLVVTPLRGILTNWSHNLRVIREIPLFDLFFLERAL